MKNDMIMFAPDSSQRPVMFWDQTFSIPFEPTAFASFEFHWGRQSLPDWLFYLGRSTFPEDEHDDLENDNDDMIRMIVTKEDDDNDIEQTRLKIWQDLTQE